MRIVNWIMAGLFALSALVQYDDPDPWRWIAIYGAAAVACLLGLRDGKGWIAPLLVGVFTLAWMAIDARSVLPNLVLRDLVRPMQEKTPAIEESRELLGLAIIAAWMIVLLVVRARRESGARSRSTR